MIGKQTGIGTAGTRPPMPYFGGKQRIAEKIVGLFPPHRHYIEPFAGGLSVLLAKGPSVLETVNDIDGDIVTFWRVLRDRPSELARACALTPHSRAEHRMAWSGSEDELEQARRVWVRLSQGRAAQLRRTGWRHYVRSGSTSVGVPGYLDAYVGRIVSAAERLHNVSLECRPALEVIDAYGADGDALLYVDPPYPSVVRGGSQCSSSYRHELRGEDQHAELLDRIRGVAARVAISGYRNPLYDRMLADWNITQMAAYTGTGNHRAEASNVRSEIVWTNFEPAQPLLISAE